MVAEEGAGGRAERSRAKEETFPKWLENEREAKGAERLLTESMREWVVRNVTPLDPTALRDG